MATASPSPSPSTSSLHLPSKPNPFAPNTPTRQLPFKLQKSYQALAGRVEPIKSPKQPVNNGDLIRRLQNGPDVRGVALEGEKERAVDFTPQAVEAIAESFAEWVYERTKSEEEDAEFELRISVGRDPRITGPMFSHAVFSGLKRGGCEVFDMGLGTTPACFMSTVLDPFGYDASIMMTASHLPYTRNGLKFFTRKGGLTSPQMEEICERAARKYTSNNPNKLLPMAQAKQIDFMSAYTAHLRSTIKERISHPLHYEAPLKGFKIVVNAGNGSGGFFARDILDRLGADTTGSLNLDPDGMFPNHIPNPEDPVAMSLTRASVIDNDADLGVVFDTDVDRSGVVDKDGNVINGDRLIALMACIVLKERPGSTIVTDARTSVGLSEFIGRRGGKHCLYRVGYRNVIDKGVKLNEDGIEAVLMMETSGHGALKENYFLDDGAYMVVKIIIEMVRMKLEGSEEGIGSLIKELEEPAESIELRMDIITESQYAREKGVEVVETLRHYIQDQKLEGWKLDNCGDCWVHDGCLVDSNDEPFPIDAYMYRAKITDVASGEQYGWIHIRQSVHNPNIALNMQSSVLGGCQAIARIFHQEFLLASGLDKILDIGQIDKYAMNGRL